MRTTPILTGATVLLLLAGCGGSSKPASKASGATSNSSSSGATLSKADFIAQVNKICSTENTKLQAIPAPTGATDYAAIVTNLTGTLSEFKNYLQQAEAIVPKSPDAAELQSKWIEPEKTELIKVESAISKMVADAQAKDSAKVQADAANLDSASSASKDIGTFLSSYGLTECANLEDS